MTNYNPNIASLTPETLKSTTIMYLCFPSNPHGALADMDYLIEAQNWQKNMILFSLLMNVILIFIEHTFQTNWVFGCID